ncbi:MAG: F0F1 ATP synthase subunit B [Candidatus Eisenbacteria bacterium]
MHEIDWGQVIAQVVGFLVVLFILKKYAWGPVIDMLEERRAKIQGDFDEIDAQRAEVATVRKGLDDRLAGIEHEARERIQAAVAEGESVGNEIKLKARQEAQAIQRRAEEQVERDRDKAQVALRNEMVTMVVAATEKMLREKLDADSHKKQVEAFIDSLGTVRGEGAKS